MCWLISLIYFLILKIFRGFAIISEFQNLFKSTMWQTLNIFLTLEIAQQEFWLPLNTWHFSYTTNIPSNNWSCNLYKNFFSKENAEWESKFVVDSHLWIQLLFVDLLGITAKLEHGAAATEISVTSVKRFSAVRPQG